MSSSNDPQFLSDLAGRLEKNPCELEALRLADEEVTAGNGRALFVAFFREVETKTADSWAAVGRLMTLLETMMTAHAGVATYLMGRLQPVAGRKYDHATYDRIGLWFDASTSLEAADALDRLAAEAGPSRAKRLKDWAERIRVGNR